MPDSSLNDAAGVRPDAANVDGSTGTNSPSSWQLRGNPVSDLSTDRDKLGFMPYVEAIAAFLKHEDTRPPLTMSIEGEWGTGKSSFMLQLKAELDKTSASETPSGAPPQRGRWWKQLLPKPMRPRFTFWFNAWRHDKQDAMWAAFALNITRQIRREQNLVRRLWGDVRLTASRIGSVSGWVRTISVLFLWLVVILGAVSLIAFTSNLTPAQRNQFSQKVVSVFNPAHDAKPAAPADSQTREQSPVALLIGNMSAAHFGFAILFFLCSYGFWIRKHVAKNLELHLEKYLNTPDYKHRTSFIESFHEDFKKVVRAYAGRRKIFIFIDDLDRCDVPRAADLMQAINLMIGDDEHLVFIIGMDREKVAAGITLKYKDLMPLLRNSAEEPKSPRHPSAFGYTFLEKFIQITFRVPRPDEKGIEQFLNSMARDEAAAQQDEEKKRTEQAVRRERRLKVEVRSRADSSEMLQQVKLVAPVLEWNPRRIKQFINDFRLHAYISSDLGLLDLVSENDSPEKASITLEQLGKFVAIMLTWPDLVIDLIEFPGLLAAMYGGRKILTSYQTALVERWSQEAGLAALLLAHASGDDAQERYSLANVDLRFLLNIAPRVPPEAYVTAGKVSSPASPPNSRAASASPAPPPAPQQSRERPETVEMESPFESPSAPTSSEAGPARGAKQGRRPTPDFYSNSNADIPNSKAADERVPRPRSNKK